MAVFLIILASLTYMALGAFWYSFSLFGKQWMRLHGWKSKADMKQTSYEYLIATVSSILASITLYALIHLIGINEPISGALTGGLIWLGLVASTSATTSAFAGTKLKLFLIDNLYHLVAFMLIGAIVTL